MPAPWRTTHHASQRGESLVGMMVGLGLSLVVLAAAAHMLSKHLNAHRLALQDSHVHHDMRAALDTMTRDLPHAQYVAKAWRVRGSAQCNDVFCNSTDDFSIAADRIQFSMDRNDNGLKDNNECLGFRLSAGEIKARTACAPEVWTALTDNANLKFTQLSWRVRCTPRGRFWARQVTVNLTAQWPGDPTRQWSASQTVTLRNDVPASTAPAYCGPTNP